MPFTVFAVLLTVYKLNGIYPFGSESIAYLDMPQVYVPEYTFLWDVLHGKESLFFSWNSAAGVNMTASVNSVSLLSPINLVFFLLCPRETVFDSMSWLLAVKMAAMGLAMLLFIDRKYRVPRCWKAMFALLYPFSGYVLQYYTNICWLDIAIMVPLIALALGRLIAKGRIIPYILVLSYTVIQSIYLSYMVYLYLVLAAGLYIALAVPKATRKTVILNFGFSSVAALLVSSFIAIPSFLQMKESARFGSVRGYINIIMEPAGTDTEKIAMFLVLTSLPVAMILVHSARRGLDKKKKIVAAVSVSLLALPVYFENIDLLWHLGSYNFFPMRFAFLIPFTLLTVSCSLLEPRFEPVREVKKLPRMLYPALTVAAVPVFIYAAYLMCRRFYENGGEFRLITDKNLKTVLPAYLLLVCFYAVCAVFGAKKTAMFMASLALVFEIGFFTDRALTHGVPRTREYDLAFLEYCEEIQKGLNPASNRLDRIKNPDTLLNSNYPFLIDCPAVSNFTHMLPRYLPDSLKAMGYSKSYTRILDAGGTPLTDALLNIKHTVTKEKLDKRLYEPLKTIGGFTLYRNRFSLPFGLVLPGDITESEFMEGDSFEVNNRMYSLLSTSGGELFETVDSGKADDKGLDYTIEVTGRKHLFFSAPYIGKLQRGSVIIYVNSTPVNIPYTGYPENQLYSAAFNNNLIDLGAFENETVKVSVIKINPDAHTGDVKLALLDTSELESISKAAGLKASADVLAGKRSLDLACDGESDDDYLFLPITADKGWSCRVNDETTEIETAFGAFMAVKLNNGPNTVSLRFVPYGMKAGLFISAAALLFIPAYVILVKKLKIVEEKTNTPLKILEIAYFVTVAAAYAAMYLIPMAATLFA